MKKNPPLTNIEWITLWMALRYAMGRQTIASAMLPQEVVEAYFKRLTEPQKAMIARDLGEHFNEHGAFGNPSIDNIHWIKLMRACHKDSHITVTGIDGNDYVVFECLGQFIPMHHYTIAPEVHRYMPLESMIPESQERAKKLLP